MSVVSQERKEIGVGRKYFPSICSFVRYCVGTVFYSFFSPLFSQRSRELGTGSFYYYYNSLFWITSKENQAKCFFLDSHSKQVAQLIRLIPKPTHYLEVLTFLGGGLGASETGFNDSICCGYCPCQPCNSSSKFTRLSGIWLHLSRTGVWMCTGRVCKQVPKIIECLKTDVNLESSASEILLYILPNFFNLYVFPQITNHSVHCVIHYILKDN